MKFRDNKKQAQLASTFIFFQLLLLLILPSAATALDTQQTQPLLSKAPLITDLNTYGPIRNNEGLWDISEQLRIKSNSGITTPQIAVALFENNQKAFREQNINGLLIGAVLKVPTRKQILKRSKEDAFSLFLQHWDAWKEAEAGTEAVINNAPVETYIEKKALSINTNTLPAIQKSTTKTSQPSEVFEEQQILDENTFIKESVKAATHKIQIEQQSVNKAQALNLTQSKFQTIYQKALQNISNIVLTIKQQLLFSVPGQHSSRLAAPFAVISIIIGLSLFASLIWLYRWQKIDLNEISSLPACNKDLVLESSDSEANEVQLAKKITQNNDSFWLAEQDDNEITNHDVSNNITVPVNISKFITQANTKGNITKPDRKGKNVLEAAFGNEILTQKNSLMEKNKPEVKTTTLSQPQNNKSTRTCLLDSIEEIRFVNETTRDSKINAFFDITQTENLAAEMLAHDFIYLKNNGKIDIFIQEFDEIMVNITRFVTHFDHTSDERENILQFKLSVHFIKILSEMMQADRLEQYSTTVIEFLEDILIGQTQMSTDIGDRLVVVINSYNGYINSIKEKHCNSIEA